VLNDGFCQYLSTIVSFNARFNEAGIVIAFPQQDVHVYSHSPYDVPSPDDIAPEPT